MSPREHAEALPKYGAWAPTGLDTKGLNADGREDWRVLPVCETRDSGPLASSNFDAACQLLSQCIDDETASVETFGHWGPGWFSIVLVDPTCDEAMDIAGEIVSRLANYPVLDDEDFARREEALKAETWSSYGWRDRAQMLRAYADSQEPLENLAELVATVRGRMLPRNQRIEERLLSC